MTGKGRPQIPSSRGMKTGAWTGNQDYLLALWQLRLGNRWSEIAKHIAGKNGQQCAQRWRHRVNPDISKKKWTPEEDKKLAHLVILHKNAWAEIARSMPGRTDQQCMGRWRRHLDPDIRRESWSVEEDETLSELVAEHGNQWSCISKHMHGRIAQQCRSRWKQLSVSRSGSRRGSTPGRSSVARSTVVKRLQYDEGSEYGGSDAETVSSGVSDAYCEIDDEHDNRKHHSGVDGDEEKFHSAADQTPVKRDTVPLAFPVTGLRSKLKLSSRLEEVADVPSPCSSDFRIKSFRRWYGLKDDHAKDVGWDDGARKLHDLCIASEIMQAQDEQLADSTDKDVMKPQGAKPITLMSTTPQQRCKTFVSLEHGEVLQCEDVLSPSSDRTTQKLALSLSPNQQVLDVFTTPKKHNLSGHPAGASTPFFSPEAGRWAISSPAVNILSLLQTPNVGHEELQMSPGFTSFFALAPKVCDGQHQSWSEATRRGSAFSSRVQRRILDKDTVKEDVQDHANTLTSPAKKQRTYQDASDTSACAEGDGRQVGHPAIKDEPVCSWPESTQGPPTDGNEARSEKENKAIVALVQLGSMVLDRRSTQWCLRERSTQELATSSHSFQDLSETGSTLATLHARRNLYCLLDEV